MEFRSPRQKFRLQINSNRERSLMATLKDSRSEPSTRSIRFHVANPFDWSNQSRVCREFIVFVPVPVSISHEPRYFSNLACQELSWRISLRMICTARLICIPRGLLLVEFLLTPTKTRLRGDTYVHLNALPVRITPAATKRSRPYIPSNKHCEFTTSITIFPFTVPKF